MCKKVFRVFPNQGMDSPEPDDIVPLSTAASTSFRLPHGIVWSAIGGVVIIGALIGALVASRGRSGEDFNGVGERGFVSEESSWTSAKKPEVSARLQPLVYAFGKANSSGLEQAALDAEANMSVELARSLLAWLDWFARPAESAADGGTPRFQGDAYIEEQGSDATAQEVIRSLVGVLRKVRDPSIAPVFVEGLGHDRFSVTRSVSASVVGNLGNVSAVEPLAQLFDDPLLLPLAVNALGQLGGARAVELLRGIRDKDPQMVDGALRRIELMEMRQADELGQAADALQIATLRGNLPDVSRLLAEGAPLNGLEGPTREPPLHSALRAGRLEVFRFLLEKGAEPDIRSTRLDAPLFLAASNGKVEFAKLLLEHGANPDVVSREGKTPMELAQARNDSAMVDLLISSGAKEPARQPVNIFQAIASGDLDLARKLLQDEASLKQKNEVGDLPLHIAAIKGEADMVHLLLEAGADVNGRGMDGRSPLHLCADNEEIGKMLTDAGAEVNALDDYGRRPFVRPSNDNEWLRLLGAIPGRPDPQYEGRLTDTQKSLLRKRAFEYLDARKLKDYAHVWSMTIESKLQCTLLEYGRRKAGMQPRRQDMAQRRDASIKGMADKDNYAFLVDYDRNSCYLTAPTLEQGPGFFQLGCAWVVLEEQTTGRETPGASGPRRRKQPWYHVGFLWIDGDWFLWGSATNLGVIYYGEICDVP
jgi:ankyrin repeat protein